MEEALEILWTYARREPLDSNGETVVPTINNSIAAIRIIMRLEGWAMGSEKRKMNSEKQATHNRPASERRGEWQFTFCIFVFILVVIIVVVYVTLGELLTYSAFADFVPTSRC